jgi:hypothetical protein
VQFEAAGPLRVSQMSLHVVADGRHSVPTSIALQVDGAVRQLRLPAVVDRAAENATATVQLHFPAMTGRRIRVTITGARQQLATRESTGDTVAAPVGIAEVGIPGLRTAPVVNAPDARCRSDLLTIDAKPVPVRVAGPAAAASKIDGLAVTPCDPRDPKHVPIISLAPGVHVIRTSEGVRTGLQLDRVVLASAAGGGPLAARDGVVTGLGSSPPPAPRVTVVHNGATRMRVHVSGADAPFWLVLGESQSNGWKATIAHAGALGTSHLVDGFANGWLVRPAHTSFDVVLQWTPQRRVWAAIWISVAAALLCVALAGWALVRRRATVAVPDASDAQVWVEWPGVPRWAEPGVGDEGGERRQRRRDQIVVPVLAGLLSALIVAPWVGLVMAVLVVLVQWRPRARAALVLGPPVFLTLVTAYIVYLQHHFRFPPLFEWPTLFPLARPLGWLAVVFLGVDVVAERVRGFASRPGP